MSSTRLTTASGRPSGTPHIDYGSISGGASAAADEQRASAAASSSSSLRSRALALLDTLFFTRGTRIYEISQQRARGVDDVVELAQCNTTQACVETLHAHYVTSGGSVLTALVLTHGRLLAGCALGVLLLAAIAIFAPVVLHQVVLAFSPASGVVDKPALVAWLAAFIASRLIKVVVSTQVSYCVNVVGLRIAASMRSLLFRKAMRKSLCAPPISTSSASSSASGAQPPAATAAATAKPNSNSQAVNIMNLATADVRALQQAVLSGFDVLTLPIQIFVMTYLLYTVLGVAAFAGVSMIVATLLLNYAISRRMSRSFAQLMATQDERMKTVKETFGAIQVVKFNAWETRFQHKLLGVRARELQTLAAYSYAGAASAFLSWSSSLLVSTVAFAVYALVLGESLTAAKVFTSMALFNALRDPLRFLPDTIQLVVQSTVSIKRLDAFLQAPEFVPENVERVDISTADANAPVVSVTNACFSWGAVDAASAIDDSLALSATTAATLRDITFRLERRDFAVVYGSVGAGKSSLCAALLGEMHKLAGRVAVNGRVAYYAQQPWIQNLTIRDNILFGEAFDAARYDAVLDACCLHDDLALLPAGDATEIGEKGVNLSGGQKARVSLARACYAQADIYILDSPLAAVDTVVQKAIFQQCLCSLLADKTVVLVTHNPEIIVSPVVTVRLGLASGALIEHTRVADALPRAAVAVRSATAVLPRAGVVTTTTNTTSADRKRAACDGVLVHAEKRAEGQVARAVWSRYLHAIGGVRMLIVLLVAQLLWQAFQILSDVWLSYWTSTAATATSLRSDDNDNDIDVDTFIVTYAKLAGAAAVMVFVRGVIVTFMGLRASRYLFESMTTGLLHAPLRFFDANPIGRILNRYGGDMNAVDVVTPMNISACMNAMFTVVCSVVTAVIVIRSMSLCLVPIVYLYMRVLEGYVRTFRDIRRLMGVAVSPILSHLAQSEQGVETIRAFGTAAVSRAIDENQRRVDVNNELWYTEIVMIQWFSQRMQVLCVGFLIVITASFVVFSDSFSPGLVGLVFTYALVVDASLVTLIKTWSKAENSMVNVERVLEYSALEREGHSNSGSDAAGTAPLRLQIEPPSQWPQHGAITFKHVAFRYKPHDPLVLEDVTFAIRAHEKVGVVGRTGAGKSSLTMALFRMNELARGRIVIDGIDIATLPLATLRARLSIIPQSPVLLEGSLRSFLDPFEDFSDADVLQVLAHVEVLETLQTYALASAAAASSSSSDSGESLDVESTGSVLALQLSANGDNMSVGERQLLCMARALLKRSAIVVMDEATAAMDHATERKLSVMIARELAGVTLLTIAHRLATVMASDRIMVLQDGRVAEFGSPTELLAMAPASDGSGSGGVFYELVQETKHSDNKI